MFLFSEQTEKNLKFLDKSVWTELTLYRNVLRVSLPEHLRCEEINERCLPSWFFVSCGDIQWEFKWAGEHS